MATRGVVYVVTLTAGTSIRMTTCMLAVASIAHVSNSRKTKMLTDEQKAKLLCDPDYQGILATIDKEVDYIGYKQYSHNIIGLALQEAAEKFGFEVANDLIDEFGLIMHGWSKVDKEDDI